MQTLQFIGLNPEEFKRDILKSIEEALSDMEKQKKPEKQLELLNASEVAKILRVSEPTIRRWTKKGKLTAYGLGGRVYYKREDVEAAIIKLNN